MGPKKVKSQSNSGNSKSKCITVETNGGTKTKHEESVCISDLDKEYNMIESAIYDQGYFDSILYKIKARKKEKERNYWGETY